MDLSQFCKGSKLRIPRHSLTKCGACRETVRDTLIDIRRLSATPHKVKLSLLEDAISNTCMKMPARHSPKRAKYLGKICEDLMQDEYADQVSALMHRLLKVGPASWAELGPSGKFSRDIEQQVCEAELNLCGKDEL